MDTDKKPLPGKSPDSSLTESWNVIDAQDVNNVSEGSDGESIEVIDEDAQNTDSIASSIKELENNSEPSDSSRTDEEEVHPRNCEVIPAGIENTDSRTMRLSGGDDSGGINLINTCAFLALFLAILFTGATFSVFLIKMEEFALDTLKYFIPFKSSDHSEKEYQELLNQIKTYKEESRDLKDLVTELNAAVLSLKKELVSQKPSKGINADYKKLNSPQVLSKEDLLFQQLLRIHRGNYPNENNSDQETEMPYENSFKIIREILMTLTNENEREENMDSVKTFYQIPRHLSVLSSFDSSNQNIEKFIDAWKEKLVTVNEKLIDDMKEMQLKMVRHIVKNLRTTQKSFFEELCDLKDMKNPECYETFIKPYKYSEDTLLPNGNEVRNFCSCESEKENVNIPGRQSEENVLIHTQKKKLENNDQNIERQRVRMNEKSQNVVDNKPIKNSSFNDKNVKPHSGAGDSSECATQKFRKCKHQGGSEEKNDGNFKKEEGMNSNILQDLDKGTTNSFSSFSESKNNEVWKTEKAEGDSERGKEYMSRKEGSWFLRMGKYRSKLRHSEARGDWLFERARFRRNRNRPCCRQPWYTRIPGTIAKFSRQFLRTQGFL